MRVLNISLLFAVLFHICISSTVIVPKMVVYLMLPIFFTYAVLALL